MNNKSNRIINITSVLMALLLLGIAAGPASASTQTAVNLGIADNFAILSKTGITNVPTSAITGNIGTSPITGAAITGLGCSEVTGTIYTVNAAGPACRVIATTLLTTAIGDMETAYTDAAGRTLPDYINLGTGNIGGLTLKPGLYKWSTGVIIPTDVTISGSSTDVWIFQVAGTLDIASAKQVILSGGAQSKNIFWQIAGQTTLGTTSVFNGNILGKTNIAMQTGATLNGRALAQTAVTLDQNSVNLPPKVPTKKSFWSHLLSKIKQKVGL
ncbi:MAG TPA: ice-binding family protein [Desulfosporosinus sp.]|nr:ice-binding family protein [Desulfosporosinus sp.]